jgi:hypothetical protein
MDRTIPAPHNTVCPKCQRIVKREDLNIVRFNNRIFHLPCFTIWFPARKRTRKYITPSVTNQQAQHA